MEYNGNYKNNFPTTNSLNFDFNYDESNRIISANCTTYANKGCDIDNTYDRDGNILTLKRYNYANALKDDFACTFYPNTNRLKKVSALYADYLYDLNGNLTKDDINKNFEIKYDHRNLVTFLKHNIYGLEGEVYTQAIYYYYDDNGNRIRKVVLQSYFIDPEIPLVLDELKNYPEYDEESFYKDAADYLNDDLDNPIMWFLVSNEYYILDKSGKELLFLKGDVLEKCNIIGRDNEGYIDLQNHKFYYLKDHLGSIRVVANGSNAIVSAQDYDMWGFLIEGRSFDSYKSKYKFTGKERDKESNLDYFGARYYDSRIGRWISIDTLFEKHYDFSPYNYVLNNTLRLVDPDGKQVDFTDEKAEKIINKELQGIRKTAEDVVGKIKDFHENVAIPWAERFIVRQGIYAIGRVAGVAVLSNPSVAVMVATTILIAPGKLNQGEDDKLAKSEQDRENEKQLLQKDNEVKEQEKKDSAKFRISKMKKNDQDPYR